MKLAWSTCRADVWQAQQHHLPAEQLRACICLNWHDNGWGEQVFQRQMSKEGLQSVVNSSSGPASNAVSSEVPAPTCTARCHDMMLSMQNRPCCHELVM